MTPARSAAAQVGVRVVTPLALVLATYLLFAGHNRPGGGFAAGLVLGALATLRTAAGISRPTRAYLLVAGGSLVVAAVAVMPLLWGDVLLNMAVVSTEVPLLGKVKTGSALPFDIGVTAIVVGLVIALLDGLSAPALDDDGSFSSREGVS